MPDDRDDSDELLEATTALVPRLLSALEALAWIGRHLHPPDLPRLARTVEEFRRPLADARAAFAEAIWPAPLTGFRDTALVASDLALQSMAGLIESATDANGVLRAYRAMRHATHAVEALYPLSLALPPVSRFFIDPERRADESVLARLAAADAGRDHVGVLHAENARTERGGVSMYIPEDYDSSRTYPLVVALHGGSGHGRDFLWTWLREARTRSCILMSPTAVGDTWSLMEPGVDGERLVARIERAAAHWSIDRTRILLTGMSDGGTMSLLAGVARSGPWTHLAPIASAFHPMVLDGARELRGLPIYLVHGALDWMFPIETARLARDGLAAAGAALTYREIDDLSHTYPREENARILDWLLGADEPATP